MTWWKCPHCGRRGDEADARTGYEPGDRDQPSYRFDACRICAPDDDDLDRLRAAMWERRLSEARDE